MNLVGFDVIQETHLLVVSMRAFPELSVDILNIGNSSCGLGSRLNKVGKRERQVSIPFFTLSPV